MLKMNDIKDWDAKTVDAKVTDLRRELFEAKMQQTAAGYDKPHRMKEIKKDIARLLTAKNAKGN